MATMTRLRCFLIASLSTFLLCFPEIVWADVEARVRQVDSEDDSLRLVVQSSAQGTIAFSVTGAGAIRSGNLTSGASATYRYKKPGVLQFSLGTGPDKIKGIAQLERGKRTELIVSGQVASPMPEDEPVPPPNSELSFQPVTGGAIQVRNPFGPVFEKLSTTQKIRMVEESKQAEDLSTEEKNRLLGFLYNQKGVEEANSRLFRQAETSLLEAKKRIPDERATRLNLIFVIAADANKKRAEGKLLESGRRFQEALRLLEETTDPNLDSQIRAALANLYVEQAASLADANKSGKKALFEKALEQNPDQPHALVQLGQMAYAEYDLVTALAFFENAYRVTSDQGLAQLIEKIGIEIEEAGDFVTQERGDFKISFEGREVKSIARETRNLLAAAQRDVGRKLGLRPKGKIPVVIYSGGQFQQILGLHSWAGGAYDGKIRLPIADLSDQDLRDGRDRIRKLVFHEYTHAVIHNRARNVKVPIWYHEGVAQLASGETPGDANRYRQMASAVTSGLLPPPSEMTVAFASVEDSGSARMLYLASYSFIHHLLEERGGWSKVRKTMGELSSGEGFIQAIESAYRRSLEDLEDEWIEELGRRGRSTW